MRPNAAAEGRSDHQGHEIQRPPGADRANQATRGPTQFAYGEVDGRADFADHEHPRSDAREDRASSDSRDQRRSPVPHRKRPRHRWFPRYATLLTPGSTCDTPQQKLTGTPSLCINCKIIETNEHACLMAYSGVPPAELSRSFGRKELSPVELVDHVLQRATQLQPHLNFLVLIDESGARGRGARLGSALDEERAAVAPRRRADLDQGHHDGKRLADASRLARDGRNAGIRRRTGRRPPARRRPADPRQEHHARVRLEGADRFCRCRASPATRGTPGIPRAARRAAPRR